MTGGPNGGEAAGGPSPGTDVQANAWEETLSDLRAIEDSYEGKGWETIATAAGDTGPVAPRDGEGYWGLVHVVPDGHAAAVADAVAGGDFPMYEVHRAAVEGRLFGVTSLLDPAEESALLVAHQFLLRDATELVEHTREVGVLNTVIRYLDGTVVAQFEHEDPGKFFPKYDDFEEFATGWPGTGQGNGQ